MSVRRINPLLIAPAQNAPGASAAAAVEQTIQQDRKKERFFRLERVSKAGRVNDEGRLLIMRH